jgi:hypothetical protein
MANEITTYAELKTAIPTWYKDRSDLADYADVIIDLAEAYFNLSLRVRKMEEKTDLTPVLNVCTLPSDYIEYKRVVELASIRRPLDYITEEGADRAYPSRASGLACHFMIVGDDLTALPLSSNDIELTYYQAIPALSGSNTTNWLLTKAPNLYLHTCKMYAAEFTEDTATFTKEVALVTRFVELLQEQDNRGKFGNAGIVNTEVPVW